MREKKKSKKWGKWRFLERTTMRVLHEVPHTAVLSLLGTDFQHLSPVQSRTTTHRSGKDISSTHNPPFPNATKAEAISKPHKFFRVFCATSVRSSLPGADEQSSCTAREQQWDPLDSKASPYCSWASVTWRLFKCLILDPICNALAFLLSCVCTDWSHLHMQIKCQYETLNIPSTSFSAAATWVNISLHPLVRGEGSSWVSKC